MRAWAPHRGGRLVATMVDRYNRSTVNPDAPTDPQTTQAAATSPMAEQIRAPIPAHQRTGFQRATPWVTLLLMLSIGGYAWQTSRRLGHLEAELVKRQESSQSNAQEALLLAKQSQDLARDASAQVALFNAKMAEVSLQRAQMDTLVQSLSQSRDENLLADVDASLRVAMQQAGLTGSAEPLVAALQAADDRLARAEQARLEPVRRALIKDLDELRGTQLSDVASLAIRLDEAVRLVDDLPLLSEAFTPRHASGKTDATAVQPQAQRPGRLPADTSATSPWSDRLMRWGQSATQSAWQEAKTLVRVTRIAQPEAALLAPEQAFFLKENLKLRLLNARLSLLSRQTSTALTDLQTAKLALDKYFDPRARKTTVLKSLLNDVSIQARQVQIPTPDDTLAALHTLGSKP